MSARVRGRQCAGAGSGARGRGRGALSPPPSCLFSLSPARLPLSWFVRLLRADVGGLHTRVRAGGGRSPFRTTRPIRARACIRMRGILQGGSCGSGRVARGVAAVLGLWGESIHSARWYRSMMVFLAVVVLALLAGVRGAGDAAGADAAGGAGGRGGPGRGGGLPDQAGVARRERPGGRLLPEQLVRDHYERRRALRAERWQRSLAFMTVDSRPPADGLRRRGGGADRVRLRPAGAEVPGRERGGACDPASSRRRSSPAAAAGTVAHTQALPEAERRRRDAGQRHRLGDPRPAPNQPPSGRWEYHPVAGATVRRARIRLAATNGPMLAGEKQQGARATNTDESGQDFRNHHHSLASTANSSSIDRRTASSRVSLIQVSRPGSRTAGCAGARSRRPSPPRGPRAASRWCSRSGRASCFASTANDRVRRPAVPHIS